MFACEKYFYKLPAILREMEGCADTTFASLVEANVADPMTYIANIIAAAHDGEGYAYGIHADNAIEAYKDETRVAVRMKDAHGVIVNVADDVVADIDHHIGSLAPIDLVLFATAVKTSLNGYYMLVRYDLLACYANPYLKTNDSIWEFYDGILCECRSTVVDVRDMSVVSLPYYKFRNLNECVAYDTEHVRAAIDAADGRLVATEKLDGSMIQMRYVADADAFEHGLLYSTSGTLAGSAGSVGNEHIDALVGYHLEGAELDKYLGVAKAYPNLTFIYEFVHPETDRHVVVYASDKHGLYMTGARDVETGRLCGYAEIARMAKAFDIPYPEVLATTLDEALAIQKDGDGSACEGMVVNVGDSPDGSSEGGWLVKVKLDGFLAISHIYHEIEGVAGFKAIAKMVLDNTVDDALPILPDGLREYVEAVIARFETFEVSQRAVIDKLVETGLEKSGGDRKGFALYVNDLACPSHWKGWLFATAFKGGVECFWADKIGEEWRYLPQKEFEDREAALEAWVRS